MSRKRKSQLARVPTKAVESPDRASAVTRRAFLRRATATSAAAAFTLDPALRAAASVPQLDVAPGGGPGGRSGPIPDRAYAPLSTGQLMQRRREAYRLREERARHWAQQEFALPLANTDELRYPDGRLSFSKSLPHDRFGHPDPVAFQALVDACRSGRAEDFDRIPLGGIQPLRNPQGALSFELAGPDSNQCTSPPAPPFASAWRAGEMVELYWAALLRDVPFALYDANALVRRACADLSALSDFRGPKSNGLVTPQTLFRGPYPGCEVGPLISQFLLKDVAFGAQINSQQVRVFAPGVDYLTSYADWLARQNGAAFGPRAYDPVHRYMRTPRDLASWVDADPPLQAGYHALAILLQMGCPLDAGNPYVQRITNQDAFTTFGPVEWFDLVGRAARPAHEAVWFQKWRIHRALRPEEFAGRVHNHALGAVDYPLHADVLESAALAETFRRFGTYLCPQAYPDGAPTHPAYPSGHSVGVGATVTMLKAIFDESFVIPDPVEATPDGLALVPYVGPPLTVGGELNKLAFNIGMARVMSGIHWRSDVVEGNALGEAVSLGILSDMGPMCSEPFRGYSLTKFDGTQVTT